MLRQITRVITIQRFHLLDPLISQSRAGAIRQTDRSKISPVGSQLLACRLAHPHTGMLATTLLRSLRKSAQHNSQAQTHTWPQQRGIRGFCDQHGMHQPSGQAHLRNDRQCLQQPRHYRSIQPGPNCQPLLPQPMTAAATGLSDSLHPRGPCRGRSNRSKPYRRE